MPLITVWKYKNRTTVGKQLLRWGPISSYRGPISSFRGFTFYRRSRWVVFPAKLLTSLICPDCFVCSVVFQVIWANKIKISALFDVIDYSVNLLKIYDWLNKRQLSFEAICFLKERWMSLCHCWKLFGSTCLLWCSSGLHFRPYLILTIYIYIYIPPQRAIFRKLFLQLFFCFKQGLVQGFLSQMLDKSVQSSPHSLAKSKVFSFLGLQEIFASVLILP